MEPFESNHHLVVRIDGSKIRDFDSFHGEFADVFGFPGFYGCNMNAWIDCMTYLDDPEAGMTKLHVKQGGMLILVIDNATQMKKQCKEVFEALCELTAFVNWRRMDMGEEPVLALSFHA